MNQLLHPDPLAELPYTVESARQQLALLSQQVDTLPELQRAPLRAVLDELSVTQDKLCQANQLLVSVIEASPQPIICLDADGRVTLWSPAAESVFGWRAEEVYNQPNPIVPADKHEEFRSRFSTILDAAVPYRSERQHQRKDGTPIDVLLSTAPIRNGENEIVGAVGIFTDITERKQTEDALHEQQELYRQLLLTSPDAIIVADPDTSITFASQQACHILGAECVEDVIGVKALDIVAPEDRERAAANIRAILQGQRTKRNQYTILRRDGTHLIGEVSSAALCDADGNPTGAIVILRDVTEQKRTVDALRESEERFRAVFETAQDAIFIKDCNRVYTHVNPTVIRQNQKPAAEIIGKTDRDLVGEEADTQIEPVDRRVLAGEVTEQEHTRVLAGVPHTLHTFKVPLRDSTGQVIGICGIARDVTERKRVEEELRASQELYRRLLEASPDAITVMDEVGRVTFASNRVLDVYGEDNPDELIGRNVLEWVAPEDREKAFDAIQKAFSRKEYPISAHYVLLKKDGSRFDGEINSAVLYDADGNPTGGILITRDITERLRAEEALRRSEAMLRETQAMARVGGWELDARTRQLTWTHDAYRVHGVPKGAPVSMDDGLNFYIPEHRSILQSAVLRALETGEPFDLELLQLIRATGKQRWVRVTGKVHYEGNTIVKVSGTGQDITERKQAELALRDSEARLRSIVRVAPVGIGVVVNRVISQANDRLCTMTGYTRDELLTQSARILYLSDEEFDYVGTEKYAQIAEGGTGTVETRWQRKDGTCIDVLLSSTPLDPDDLTAGVTFTALDITERKQAEAALRESELRYRTVADFTHDMEYWVSHEDKLCYVSPACERITGYTHEQFMAHPELRHKMVLPEDIPLWREHCQQTVDSPGQNQLQLRIRRADGAIRWIEHICRPVTDDQGNHLGFRASNRDITDRKQTQDALRESEARYRILVENFPNGMVALFDHDLHVMLAGGQGFAQVSPSAEELIGKSLHDIFPPEFFERDEPAWRAALQGETTVSDMAFVTRHYRVHTLPVRNAGGDVVAGMIMAQDLTDQIQAEQRRVDLALERERVKVLTDFIQNASHEFSSPLSIINTNLYLLARSCDSAQQHQQIDSLKQQAQQIASLVKAMLTMSRLDSGVSMTFTPTDINQLLRDIETRILPTIDQKQLAFALNLDTTSPQVSGDQRELYQALLNVLDNAVQFTPEGGAITVGTAADATQITITVQDTGIGIGEHDLPHIFERFYRADKARTTRGAGLGLPVARKIIEQHGGTIQVDSVPDQGTTFTVTLPRQS
jgi:PAS domain S-box-containing protein